MRCVMVEDTENYFILCLPLCASFQGRIQDFFKEGVHSSLALLLENTSCIRKLQVISGGGGEVRTPCTLPLDPPLVSHASTALRLLSIAKKMRKYNACSAG